MLRPSGSACSTSTSAPSAPQRARRRARTRRRSRSRARRAGPSSVRPSSAPSRCSTYASTPSARSASTPTSDAGGPARAGEDRVASSASIAASTSSGSLRPPGANSFTPLSVHGLWLAEIDRGRRRRRAARGTRRRASAARRATHASTPFGREPGGERGLDARARLARVAADRRTRSGRSDPRRGPTERDDELVR